MLYTVFYSNTTVHMLPILMQKLLYTHFDKTSTVVTTLIAKCVLSLLRHILTVKLLHSLWIDIGSENKVSKSIVTTKPLRIPLSLHNPRGLNNENVK